MFSTEIVAKGSLNDTDIDMICEGVGACSGALVNIRFYSLEIYCINEDSCLIWYGDIC